MRWRWCCSRYPLCTVKLEIAGYADLAAEDVLCPLSEARQWF